MALSNIGREPRREWTEQGAGVLAAVAWLLGCKYLAHPLAVYINPQYYSRWDGTKWLMATSPTQVWALTVLFSILLAVIPFLIVAAWYLLHAIGEGVCGLMASMGFDPRPRKRI